MRNFREGYSILFFVCGTPAGLKPFGFSSAELPRGPNYLVSCLRNFRGAQTIWFFVCGSSARPKPFSFSLAELPRGSNRLVSCLRKFREAKTIWFLICGTPARLKPFGFSSAEVPRSPNHLVFRLRNSRKVVSICFLIRASDLLPHSISGFARVNSGVPPACRDRPRVCPHHSGSQNRIHIQKYVLRSVDRIGAGIGAGIGQTRGLSLRVGPSGPNWHPSTLRPAGQIRIK